MNLRFARLIWPLLSGKPDTQGIASAISQAKYASACSKVKTQVQIKIQN
jgi:hypothetical protein